VLDYLKKRILAMFINKIKQSTDLPDEPKL